MFKKKRQILALLILMFTISTCLHAVAKGGEQTSTEGSGFYIDKKIDIPVAKIGSPDEKESKVESLDFCSPSFTKDLEKYLINNIEFPKGYVISFSFSYDKTGTIAKIHLVSTSDTDFHDGNEHYSSSIYGDVCKRDGLSKNQIYILEDSTTADLKAVPISKTKDGKFLQKMYNSIKNMGNFHIIQVPYEKHSEFSSIGGMYYRGKLYINQ